MKPLVLSLLFSGALCGTVIAAYPPVTPSCEHARIPFETSTLRKILTETDSVMRAGEDFWRGEKPLILAQGWADEVGSRNPYAKFAARVSALAELSEEERTTHPLSVMTETIGAAQDEWRRKALAHLCSYLPEGSHLSRPIYFVAYIPPRAFATSEGIVLDVAAKYWQGNPDNILNMLVHEFFHVGYGQARRLRSEAPLGDERIFTILEMLQNEGMAVWVAHEALSLFPAPDERDNQLLDNPEDVTRLLAELNDLLAQAGEAEEDEFRRLAWRVGVTGRAYYITGAHMARTIETERGREALIGTLLEGPLSYSKLYNSLVTWERQVHFPELPQQTQSTIAAH